MAQILIKSEQKNDFNLEEDSNLWSVKSIHFKEQINSNF